MNENMYLGVLGYPNSATSYRADPTASWEQQHQVRGLARGQVVLCVRLQKNAFYCMLSDLFGLLVLLGRVIYCESIIIPSCVQSV